MIYISLLTRKKIKISYKDPEYTIILSDIRVKNSEL